MRCSSKVYGKEKVREGKDSIKKELWSIMNTEMNAKKCLTYL